MSNQPDVAEGTVDGEIEAADTAPEPADDSVMCGACGEANPMALSWCEACGHDLNAEPKPQCTACGESTVEADGYCHSCGHRQPVGRDHVVVVEGAASAVSDKGKRHHHNEDAVALAVSGAGGSVVMVVCDGVSSTPGSAEISLAAAHAAVAALEAKVVDAAPSGDGAVDDDDLFEIVSVAQTAAVEAADDAHAESHNPPSTTFVLAAARIRNDGEVAVSVAWLGDSRAYWIDDGRAKLLTEDHEIAGALTRWLGPDAGVYTPDVAHYRFPTLESSSNPMLMVCSDGLWRYFSPEVGEPAESLLDRFQGEGLAGIDLAEALVAFANESGGHDNISVGLWPSTAESKSEPVKDQEEEALA